jgi:RnfABCDGE-type electron transport complex B subunit
MEQILISITVLGISGFTFSILLALLSKKLKVAEDPRVAKVLALLPGLNCGACGFSGCRAFAEAVVKQRSIFSGCLPAAAEVNKKIAEALGLSCSAESHKKIAICHCAAKTGEKKSTSIYSGPKSCKAAQITGGAIDCAYGCLGFGDCVDACPLAAINIKDGRVNIDPDKCSGCGKCLKVCPRGLFEIVPWTEKAGLYNVACSNPEKALEVKKVCSKGCIGCGLCTKVENSPYQMQGSLSMIDYKSPADIQALEAGKNKCPTKCIVKIKTGL